MMHDEWQERWRERMAAFEYWTQHGLVKRHANALARAGYRSLEQLQDAPEWELQAISNIGRDGWAKLLDLMGRPRPANLRTAAETRAMLEQAWRSRLGNERFERLMDEIIAMAGPDLERANQPAAQALWDLARSKRTPRKPTTENT